MNLNSKTKSIILAAGLLSSIINPSISEAKQHKVHHQKSEKIRLQIPSWLNSYRARWEELGALPESSDGILTTAKIESDFKYTLKEGSHGEQGLWQNTPASIEGVIERELKNKLKTNTDKVIHSQIRPYLDVFDRKTLAAYIGQNKLERFIARKWVIGNIRSKIRYDIIRNMNELKLHGVLAEDHDADSDFGSSKWFYDKKDVLGICRKAKVKYTNAMTDARYNATVRTRLAILHCKSGWQHCDMLPTITKNRKFSSYKVIRNH